MRINQVWGTVIGLSLVVTGLIMLLNWWDSVMLVLKGLSGVIVILAGAFVIGLSRE